MTDPLTTQQSPRLAARRPVQEADRRALLIARVQRVARQRRRARILTRRAG